MCDECRPDLIQYNQLRRENPEGNLENAFRVAEQLTIARLLDVPGVLPVLSTASGSLLFCFVLSCLPLGSSLSMGVKLARHAGQPYKTDKFNACLI